LGDTRTELRTMSRDTEAEQIARYLAAEMTAPEAAGLERAAAADPGLAARLRTARAAWTSIEPALPAAAVIDVDAAWTRFAERAARADAGLEPARRARPAPMPRLTPGARRTPARWTPLRAAAALVLVATGVLVWRAAQSQHSVLATAAGEQRSWRLADGSQVTLGPASRLVVLAGYGGRHRTVELAGDAYFRAADSDAPQLVVRAGGAVVRDIGTAFAVHAARPGAAVDVVVTEGAVRLEPDAGDGVLLVAGEQGRFDPARGAVEHRGRADLDRALAWTRGRLIFDDVSLDDVAHRLGRWYGVDVRVGDAALAARRLSASFEDEPLDEVLGVIARSLGAVVQRQDGRVVFHPRDGTP
jgi:transmembrane sensor